MNTHTHEHTNTHTTHTHTHEKHTHTHTHTNTRTHTHKHTHTNTRTHTHTNTHTHTHTGQNIQHINQVRNETDIFNLSIACKYFCLMVFAYGLQCLNLICHAFLERQNFMAFIHSRPCLKYFHIRCIHNFMIFLFNGHFKHILCLQFINL